MRGSARRVAPILAILAVLLITIAALRLEGRRWMCACGYVSLWVGETKSAQNSQQIADPYSFTHLLHGFLFLGGLALVVPRLQWTWQVTVAIVLEAAWEVLENSAAIIERYRQATISLGYTGDTILNSVADIACCGLGLVLARWLGWRRAIVVFVVTELVLAFWIRDSLLLNILMLLYPVPAIREWQAGG